VAENRQGLEIEDLFFQAGFLPPRARAPRLYAHLAAIQIETGWFTLREKARFQRARPYHVEPTLDLAIPPPPHPSYPSGHAAQSMAVALAYGRVNPACAQAAVAWAQGVGGRREAAGVHFPSDTAAGQVLARAVVEGWVQAGWLDESVEGPLRAELDDSTALACAATDPR